MLDIKAFKIALDQLEQERKIQRKKIMDAIEQALVTIQKRLR